jgi:hypothetical protein
MAGPSQRTFSCAQCYQSKRKCDKSVPCSHCSSRGIDCLPSTLETTERPRKRRFPEAELLDRIAKYESALLSYGADLEAISGDAASRSRHQSLPPSPATTSTALEDVTASFIAVIEGEDDTSNPDRSWYDDVFAHDGSELLFAVDSIEVPAHPSPFDFFKLWQVYRDNIHPISKLLHAPTFQRKISSFGSLLHIAPAADQALFFSVYAAAITSLSAEQVLESFSVDKEVVLEQYNLATQVWLRRANVWKTADLTVVQAFVLFLSSIQHSIDPRTLACFTGTADRIARRIGLHRDIDKGIRPLDREMRTRIWWEIVLLGAKAVERAGLGTSISTGQWDARLPSACSDVDLESMDVNAALTTQTAPSSEIICFMIRAEVSLFTAELHSERTGRLNNRIDSSTLPKRLESIDLFEQLLQARYLCSCDKAISTQRLSLLFSQSALSRLRLSAYIVEDSSKATIGLVRHCTDSLDVYNQMRSDTLLQQHKWFILQHLPVFAYIILLRLFQQYTSGDFVERAWQVLQVFKGAGPRRTADVLMLKAWEARKRDSLYGMEDPAFIKAIQSRTETQATLISSASDTIFSESEMMALMAEILSSEVYSDMKGPG